MSRRWLQPLWFLLAVAFLIEAWFWDHLEPAVAWVIARVPLRKFKTWLVARIETLSPALTLLVFLVPVAPLYPLKLLALMLMAQQQWIAGIAIFLVAQVIGLGVAAFIFDATKPKLLQMRWFERLYLALVALKAKAHEVVAPIMTTIRTRVRALLGGAGDGWGARTLRLLQRFRKRVQQAR